MIRGITAGTSIESIFVYGGSERRDRLGLKGVQLSRPLDGRRDINGSFSFRAGTTELLERRKWIKERKSKRRRTKSMVRCVCGKLCVKIRVRVVR